MLQGVRAALLRCYGTLSPAVLAQGCPQQPQAWPRMLFVLAFFHALVLERRKYGSLGWNTSYDFSDGDWLCARQTLSMFLNTQVHQLALPSQYTSSISSFQATALSQSPLPLWHTSSPWQLLGLITTTGPCLHDTYPVHPTLLLGQLPIPSLMALGYPTCLYFVHAIDLLAFVIHPPCIHYLPFLTHSVYTTFQKEHRNMPCEESLQLAVHLNP